jgi:O-methyltransferase
MNDPKALYIELVKKSLLCALYEGMDGKTWSPRGFLRRQLLKMCLPSKIWLLQPTDPASRTEGKDWPPLALTMIGFKRLDNLQFCVERVLADGVPGDLIETGVWRGGATILMRAILMANDVTDRRVWVADSFQGLPRPDAHKFPADAGDQHHQFTPLAVSLEQVKANFQRYGLLDDQVCFLKGWFRDTLPTAPIEKLAVIRLDGDMYESTMDGLVNLYPKLSPGGYLIVDDYGAVPACKQAVHDYRGKHGINETIHTVDWTGVYWQRSSFR